ncbi:MAG: hypothetical protein J5639_05955 [Bacteroidales bacterium]|nr:hypothetical protein [Bacteroidales bacterium]
MKKILVSLALMCMAICSYAQKDVPVGGSMEVASIESDDYIGPIGQGKQITMYKVKDNDGNPSFLLCVSHTLVSFSFGTEDSNSTFNIPGGAVMLDFGTTYEEAMDNLDALLNMFDEKDGAQKEIPCLDGSTIPCTLYKGFLGKHLDIADTSITKSDIKSLIFSFKISKKLHVDL